MGSWKYLIASDKWALLRSEWTYSLDIKWRWHHIWVTDGCQTCDNRADRGDRRQFRMQSMDIVRSHKPVLALQFESEIRLIWRDDQFRRLSPFKWNSPYTYSNIYESERNFHKIFMEVFQLFDGSVISFNHPFTSALSISNWVSCCLTDSFVY